MKRIIKVLTIAGAMATLVMPAAAYAQTGGGGGNCTERQDGTIVCGSGSGFVDKEVAGPGGFASGGGGSYIYDVEDGTTTQTVSGGGGYGGTYPLENDYVGGTGRHCTFTTNELTGEGGGECVGKGYQGPTPISPPSG